MTNPKDTTGKCPCGKHTLKEFQMMSEAKASSEMEGAYTPKGICDLLDMTGEDTTGKRWWEPNFNKDFIDTSTNDFLSFGSKTIISAREVKSFIAKVEDEAQRKHREDVKYYKGEVERANELAFRKGVEASAERIKNSIASEIFPPNAGIVLEIIDRVAKENIGKLLK